VLPPWYTALASWEVIEPGGSKNSWSYCCTSKNCHKIFSKGIFEPPSHNTEILPIFCPTELKLCQKSWLCNASYPSDSALLPFWQAHSVLSRKCNLYPHDFVSMTHMLNQSMKCFDRYFQYLIACTWKMMAFLAIICILIKFLSCPFCWIEWLENWGAMNFTDCLVSYHWNSSLSLA